MDRWSERLGASSLKADTDSIETKVGELLANGVAEASVDLLQRQATVARYVCRRVYGADPRLVPADALSKLETGTSQVLATLSLFESSGDIGHLATADTSTEAVLGELRAVPASRRSDGDADVTQAFRDDIATLERRGEAAVAAIETSSSNATQAISASLNDAQTRTDVAVANAQSQLAAVTDQAAAVRQALTDEKLAFDQELTAQKTRIDTFIQNGQSQLTKLQSDVADAAVSQREAITTANAAASEDQRTAWDGKFAVLEDAVAERLAFFHSQESAVKRILGAVAASQTAGAYLEESNNQQKEANVWRWLSFGGWLVAIVLSIWSAHEVTSSVADTSGSRLVALSAARLAVAGVALSFAFWVSSQSSHHRKREEDARAIASELTTLRPFLAELPEQHQQEALNDAFKKYFPGKKDAPRPSA